MIVTCRSKLSDRAFPVLAAYAQRDPLPSAVRALPCVYVFELTDRLNTQNRKMRTKNDQRME